jgi:hypothetical protein
MTTNETHNTLLIGMVTRYITEDGLQRHRHSYSRLVHSDYLLATLQTLYKKNLVAMEKFSNRDFEVVSVRILRGEYEVLRPLWDAIYAEKSILFHQKMPTLESESGNKTEKIFDLSRDQITFTSWMHDLMEQENA